MKTNMLKLSQEICGRSEVASPKRFTQPAALYLMQLRSHVLRISMANRRLFIAVEDRNYGEMPQLVKITHIS
jgi:hypothetical protein